MGSNNSHNTMFSFVLWKFMLCNSSIFYISNDETNCLDHRTKFKTVSRNEL